jgi:hypothetical protein
MEKKSNNRSGKPLIDKNVEIIKPQRRSIWEWLFGPKKPKIKKEKAELGSEINTDNTPNISESRSDRAKTGKENIEKRSNKFNLFRQSGFFDNLETKSVKSRDNISDPEIYKKQHEALPSTALWTAKVFGDHGTSNIAKQILEERRGGPTLKEKLRAVEDPKASWLERKLGTNAEQARIINEHSRNKKLGRIVNKLGEKSNETFSTREGQKKAAMSLGIAAIIAASGGLASYGALYGLGLAKGGVIGWGGSVIISSATRAIVKNKFNGNSLTKDVFKTTLLGLTIGGVGGVVGEHLPSASKKIWDYMGMGDIKIDDDLYQTPNGLQYKKTTTYEKIKNLASLMSPNINNNPVAAAELDIYIKRINSEWAENLEKHKSMLRMAKEGAVNDLGSNDQGTVLPGGFNKEDIAGSINAAKEKIANEVPTTPAYTNQEYIFDIEKNELPKRGSDIITKSINNNDIKPKIINPESFYEPVDPSKMTREEEWRLSRNVAEAPRRASSN